MLQFFSTDSSDRKGNGDFCPLSAAYRHDFKFAAQQSRPLSHAQKSHGLGIGDLLGSDPAPVVFYLHNNSSVTLFQMDGYLGRASVADDVGQGFLKDAEEGRCQILV